MGPSSSGATLPRVILTVDEIEGSLTILAWLEDTLEEQYSDDWAVVNA